MCFRPGDNPSPLPVRSHCGCLRHGRGADRESSDPRFGREGHCVRTHGATWSLALKGQRGSSSPPGVEQKQTLQVRATPVCSGCTVPCPAGYWSRGPMSSLLFAFVDLKDPFTAGEIADEPPPGPLLSILAAHTGDNAEATLREIEARHPDCRAELRSLSVSDPKDYSAIMGALGRLVRNILVDFPGGDRFICVSSGTAEMRAAWFLLRAAKVIPAWFLQVGSPANCYSAPLAYERSRSKTVTGKCSGSRDAN
jgi:hypothetical protein